MVTVRWEADAAERYKLRLFDQYVHYGSKTAEDWADEIKQAIELIKTYPEAAPATPRGTRIKTTTQRNYKIEYEYDSSNQTISILRVSK